MIKNIMLSGFILASVFGCVSSKKKQVFESEAKPQADDLKKKLSIENENYTLPNGLKVILSVDKKSPFVAVSMWYEVGSVNEEKGKTGLAHLFEHLMFEGSKHVKAGEHFKFLDDAGAFGLNASTSFERTNYYQTVPKSVLPLALALEADRMSDLVLTQEKLDEQRAVVRREREQRFEATPYGLAALTQWQHLFPAPDPMREMVIGLHEDIESATLKDVQEFYNKYYGPSNATLTLVGDFDKDEAKKLITRYFGKLKNSPAIPIYKYKHKSLGEEQVIRYSEKLGKLALLRIQYLTPALFKPGDADLDIVSLILTGNENGRLTKALTRDTTLANSVSASQQSMGNISVFSIDVLLNQNTKPAVALKEVDKVITDLVQNPPTKAEIDRARNSILSHFFFGLQNLGGSNGRAETLQSYNRYASDPNFMQKDLARYQAVDEASIVKTVKEYLPVNRNRVILEAIPNQEPTSKRKL